MLDVINQSISLLDIRKDEQTLLHAKVSLIVGGYINQERRNAIEQQERPRIDVIEMEKRFGAACYDFSWFDRIAAKEKITQLMRWASRNLFGGIGLWFVLRVLWATRRDDIVYATGEDVGLPFALLLRTFCRKRPRLILRLEQPTYGRTRLRRALFNMYLRLSIKRVDLTLCRTQAHAELLTKAFKILPRKVYFISEPTDTVFFSREQPVVPAALAVVPERPFLVSAGLEMRDYATLIEAVRNLPLRVVIGAGSPWSKFQFDSGSEQALPPNVEVRSFSPVQMRELYRVAEIVVVPVKPTLRACGMNVVLEAWAMQRPVIASRTTGLLDYIQDGQTGCLVKAGNPEALRQAILGLLARPEAAAHIGNLGYRHVVEMATVDTYVCRISHLMSFVLRETRGLMQ